MPVSIRDVAASGGALMEPSGRNQWQPVAVLRPRNRRIQAKTVTTICDRLPIGAW